MDVGVVGLGTIARTHLAVLQALPDVRVVFGADPADRPAADLPDGAPRYASLGEALDRAPDVDLLVVATPTLTHTTLVSQALQVTEARVLAEKPLGTTSVELDALETAHGRDVLDARLRVAHHFAFSPEVLWAAEIVESRPEWGAPTRVVCSFNDAYAAKSTEQRASYVSCWIDSAPNQLSLLSRFVTGFAVVDRVEADGGLRCGGRVSYDGGEALLVSNWLAGDTSKQTSLHFRGGVEVRMDHTSMTVLVLEDGRLTHHVGYAGSRGRKFAHYEGLYRAVLGGDDGPEASYGLARELAALLGHESAVSQGAAGFWATAWHTHH